MALYFLHLHHCGNIVHDEEGIELETDEKARDVALMTARELIGADALNGMMALNSRINIANTAGDILGSVSFRESITIIE